MFVIGNYYVRFDFDNKRLLVINKTATDAYNTLKNGSTAQSGVMVLGFDEEYEGVEFFEELENGTVNETNYTNLISPSIILGKCARANTNKDGNDDVWSVLKMDEHGRNDDCDDNDLVDYKRDYKLVYQRFLIYYRIIGKAKCLTQCAGTNPLQRWEIQKDIHLNGTIKYDIRCNGEKTGSFDETSYTDMKKWEPYEGSRSLSRYDCTIYMQTKHTWDATYGHNTPLNIKSGY